MGGGERVGLGDLGDVLAADGGGALGEFLRRRLVGLRWVGLRWVGLRLGLGWRLA